MLRIKLKQTFVSRSLRSLLLLIVLVTTATLLLSACGDQISPTATNPSVTANTSGSNSTPGATSAATQAITTPSPTVGSSATIKSDAMELLALLPDTAESLKEINFNNYASLRTLYAIPDNTTFAQIQNDPELSKRWQSSLRHLTYVKIYALEQSSENLPELLGYDLFQLDQGIQVAQSPFSLGIAKGRFDNTAIEKAFGTAQATKGQVGVGHPFYTLAPGISFENPIKRNFLAFFDNVVLIPEKKLLLASAKPAQVEQAVQLADGTRKTGSLKDNPAVSALLGVFGSAHTFFISNNFGPRPIIDLVASANNLDKIKQKAQEELKKSALLPSVLAGFAYFEDKPGEGSYLLSNYYQSPELAKQALPLLEQQLRDGISTVSKKPYQDYFEISSSEVKGNLTVIKLKMKQTVALIEFFSQRDLPTFWIG